MHAPEAPSRLRAQQFALTRHLRDPQGQPAPAGIEERRLAIYRDLLFNNVESLLAGNFPVIRRLLGESDWKLLVRDFFRDHRCQTPLFPELPREFLRFLEARRIQRIAASGKTISARTGALRVGRTGPADLPGAGTILRSARQPAGWRAGAVCAGLATGLSLASAPDRTGIPTHGPASGAHPAAAAPRRRRQRAFFAAQPFGVPPAAAARRVSPA